MIWHLAAHGEHQLVSNQLLVVQLIQMLQGAKSSHHVVKGQGLASHQR
jgi:hypothetical protein